MADNTQINPMTGGDVIATADTTSLNGSPTSGVKVERVKVGYGEGPTHVDVDADTPLPVSALALEDLVHLLGVISSRLGYNDNGRMGVTLGAGTVVSVGQNGTWTVQPGNTANTTAWLVNTPVTGPNTGGYGTGLDQHYQSLSAFAEGVRSKITVT